MNAPVIDRRRLAGAISTIEQSYSLTISGLLPEGTLGHPSGLDPVVFLADGRNGLSLLDVCSAEVALEDRLGVPTRILLRSELTGDQASAITAQASPL